MYGSLFKALNKEGQVGLMAMHLHRSLEKKESTLLPTIALMKEDNGPKRSSPPRPLHTHTIHIEYT